MLDLFSIFFSGVTSWGIGRFLDACIDCRRCGDYGQRAIANRQHNHLQCSYCGYLLQEYVNLTPNTLNRNGSVAAAGFYNLNWYPTPNFFELYYGLDVIHSAGQDVVVDLFISEWQPKHIVQPQPFVHDRFTLPAAHEYQCLDGTFLIDYDAMPKGSRIVAVDLVAYNVWGDCLDVHRRSIQYDYHPQGIVRRGVRTLIG